MKINKQFVSSLIFNIAETILIFLVGRLIGLPTNFIIIVMLTFVTTRICLGHALHFKNWYRCLIWSLLILLSLFMILKIDLRISILFAIFSAFIMTGRSNINDMYLWKQNSDSKYKDVEDFIKYNEFDDTLIDFEDKLRKRDSLSYLIYKYRFKEHRSFAEISELLELDNPRIVERLDNIAFSIRLYCKI